MAPTTTTAKNPFGLPELRYHLSRFVAIKDAVSCALVSKAWSITFIPVVWFKVDFADHPRFTAIPRDIVAKHGHHIRIVKNAKSLPQVSVIANAGVNELRELHIHPTTSTMQYVRAYEVVFRNSLCLEDLDLFASSASTPELECLRHIVPPSALAPLSSNGLRGQSKLKTLRIYRMCLTHDGLVTILQGCPRLNTLSLRHTDVVGAPSQSFQHTGVRFLKMGSRNLRQIASSNFSLLYYFPNVTLAALNDLTGAIVSEFLTSIAGSASEIVFRYEHVSSEMIMAILLHQATMSSIRHFITHKNWDFDKEEVAPVSNLSQALSRLLQLIPRGCSQLNILDLHTYEMDMTEVELFPWICKNLVTLRIRVKGLDSKDKILKAIALWRKGCWRRWQEQAETPVSEEGKLDETDMSIEARVARHLLKFEQLWWVWLGYQTWTPL
ncbi:MAG: hypothetical protein J3R72DRAFT_502117 [Linnemannia gamsii]|nr:MAG: hypothetical protein J3R72DRAFT_502117 [Linnemannia gamsii]